MPRDLVMMYIVFFSFWYIFAKRYSYSKKDKQYYTEFHPGYAGIYSLLSVSIAYALVCFFIGMPMFVENINWVFLWGVIISLSYLLMQFFVKLCLSK